MNYTNWVFRTVSKLDEDTLTLIMVIHKVQLVKETHGYYVLWYNESIKTVRVPKTQCFFTEEAARSHLTDLIIEHNKKLRAAIRCSQHAELKVYAED